MSTTVEKTIADARDISEDLRAEFFNLARRAARGEVIDPATLQRAATLSGELLDSFQPLVNQLRSRQALREKIAGHADAEREMNEARENLAFLNSEHERATEEYRRKATALEDKVVRLREAWAQARTLPAALLTESPLPGGRKRLAALNHELGRLTGPSGVLDEIARLTHYEPTSDEDRERRDRSLQRLHAATRAAADRISGVHRAIEKLQREMIEF